MFKAFIVAVTGAFLALSLTAAGWLVAGWRIGFAAGIMTFSLTLIACAALVIADPLARAVLPIPLALVWCAVLMPFSLGAEIFSAPACIGSAFLLSISAALCSYRQMSRSWLVIPILTFIYEMLPINIPGPVDDYLALGGEGTVFVMQMVAFGIRGRQKAAENGPGVPIALAPAGPPQTEQPPAVSKALENGRSGDSVPR